MSSASQIGLTRLTTIYEKITSRNWSSVASASKTALSPVKLMRMVMAFSAMFWEASRSARRFSGGRRFQTYRVITEQKLEVLDRLKVVCLEDRGLCS